MASRKSCSKGLWNGTLFVKNLTRFWPLWAVLCLIWFLILPANILSSLNRSAALSPEHLRELLLDMCLPSVFLCGATGLAAAVCVWQYLCSAKAAQSFHALPLRREGLFITNFASGLTIALIPAAFAVGTTVLVCALNGTSRTPGDAVVVLLAVMAASTFFGFCLGTFCAQLTGATVMIPVLFIALNVAVLAFWWLLNGLAEILTWGLTIQAPGPVVRWLTPIWKLVNDTGVQYGDNSAVRFAGLGYYGIYSIVSLVLAALALVLNRFRHTESAGDVIAVAWLRPVFQLLVSLAAALSLPLLWLSLFLGTEKKPLVLVLFLLILGAFVGWFAARMLLKKTFRVFGKQALVGWAVFALILVLAATGLKLDVGGRQSYVPDPRQVSSVSAGFNGIAYTWTADPAETAALHQAIVDNRAAMDSSDGLDLNLTYTMNDGSQVRRSYSLSPDLARTAPQVWSRARDYISRPEAVAERLLGTEFDPTRILGGMLELNRVTVEEGLDSNGMPVDNYYQESVDLDQTQARALAAAVQNDLLAGRYSDAAWYFGGEDADMDAVGWLRLYCLPELAREGDFASSYLTITPAMTETMASLRALGLPVDE